MVTIWAMIFLRAQYAFDGYSGRFIESGSCVGEMVTG